MSVSVASCLGWRWSCGWQPTDCLWMRWFALINVFLPENNLNISVTNCPQWVHGSWRRDEAFSNFLFWIIVERSGMGMQQLAWGRLLPCCASLDTWHYCSRDESINVPTLHITQLKPLWHTPRSGFVKFSDGKHVTIAGLVFGLLQGIQFFLFGQETCGVFSVLTGESCVWWSSTLTYCLIFGGLKDKVKISNSIRFKVSMSLLKYFKGTVPNNRVYY